MLLLRLGRASNLPTVWTNAIAAWALCGGGWHLDLLWLSIAGSLLYLAGCTWNDAADAQWDAKHRPERPIPSGRLSRAHVWGIGVAQTGLGLGILAWLGLPVLISGVITVVAVLLYDWLHKRSAWTVLLMAWCRVQWALTAALGCIAQQEFPLTVGAISPAFWYYVLALAVCIITISLVARGEATASATSTAGSSIATWGPQTGVYIILFCWTWANLGLRKAAIFYFLVLLAWSAWFKFAQHTMRKLGKLGIGAFVAKNLAGICLLDAAFACNAWSAAALPLIAGFILCLALQRRIPAT
jgi:4-hydroxybenzoate polyprenyltransferase